MTFAFTKGYVKRLKRLPADVRTRSLKSLELLEADPRYPSLHFKEVAPKEGAWSMRVSQSYRMVGYKEGERITWFWIGTHSEYDALLKRLG